MHKLNLPCGNPARALVYIAMPRGGIFPESGEVKKPVSQYQAVCRRRRTPWRKAA